MSQPDDQQPPNWEEKWSDRSADSSQDGSYSNGHTDTSSTAPRPENLSGDQNDLYDEYRKSQEDRQQDS